MIDELIDEIFCLADHVEPDANAVREWFFETPLFPYGNTARELVQANRGDAVIAFLKRILRDAERDAASSAGRVLVQHAAMASAIGAR
jgi:hypothetical protein